MLMSIVQKELRRWKMRRSFWWGIFDKAEADDWWKSHKCRNAASWECRVWQLFRQYSQHDVEIVFHRRNGERLWDFWHTVPDSNRQSILTKGIPTFFLNTRNLILKRFFCLTKCRRETDKRYRKMHFRFYENITLSRVGQTACIFQQKWQKQLMKRHCISKTKGSMINIIVIWL